MKKWMFTAVLCLPLALMAQNRGGAAAPQGQKSTPAAQQLAASGEQTLCAEVIVTDRGGMTAVSIDFGAAPEVTFANDKHVKSKLKPLTSSRFTNTVDAINALTQLGFEVEASYQVGAGNSLATHIVMTKPGVIGQPSKEQASKPNTGGASTPAAKKKRK